MFQKNETMSTESILCKLNKNSQQQQFLINDLACNQIFFFSKEATQFYMHITVRKGFINDRQSWRRQSYGLWRIREIIITIIRTYTRDIWVNSSTALGFLPNFKGILRVHFLKKQSIYILNFKWALCPISVKFMMQRHRVERLAMSEQIK